MKYSVFHSNYATSTLILISNTMIEVSFMHRVDYFNDISFIFGVFFTFWICLSSYLLRACELPVARDRRVGDPWCREYSGYGLSRIVDLGYRLRGDGANEGKRGQGGVCDLAEETF